MIRYSIIICLLVRLSLVGSAQADTLIYSFVNQSDKEIVDRCNAYADSCINNGAFKTCIPFFKSAQVYLNSKLGKPYFDIEFLIGRNLYYQNKYSDGLRSLKKTLSSLDKDWTILASNCRRFIGFSALALGEFGEALGTLNINYDLAIEEGDSAAMYATLSDIAIVHYSAKEYNKCALNWEQYLAYCKSIGNISEVSSISGNLGLIYTLMKIYDKAEIHLINSYRISDSLGIPAQTRNALNNLGKLEFERQNFDKAEGYMLRSIKMLEETNAVKDVINGYSNLGEIFISAGKFQRAKHYLDKAYALCSTNNYVDKLSALYHNYSDYYNDKGEYKLAFRYLDSTMQLKDSLLNIEKLKEVAEIETKYRVQQKDDSIKISQQNLILASQNLTLAKTEKEYETYRANKEKLRADSRSTQILGLLALIVAILVLGVIIYRTSRVNKARNVVLAKQKEIIEVKNKNITDSIRYAKNLQTAILPDINIIRETIPNYVLFYAPRDIVSGDFYWFHESADKVYIVAADCTGHGVPGAFVSMLCNDALNKVVITLKTIVPGEILSKVNKTVIEAFRKEKSSYKANDGMDISLCVLDKKTRNMAFAGAMNRLLLIRNNEIFEYKGDKTAIGGKTDPNFEFTTQYISTQDKDSIYMFSDGYIDQFGGPNGKKYMIKRFKNLLQDIHHLKADQQKDRLEENLLAWRGETDQIDDILVIGFNI